LTKRASAAILPVRAAVGARCVRLSLHRVDPTARRPLGRGL